MTVHEVIAIPVEQKVWKVRVQDFLVLEESGAFVDYARAELLDGEIWVLNAIHSRHAAAQAELQGQLWAALRAAGSSLRTYVTPTVVIENRSRIEPDLAVGPPNDGGLLPVQKIRLAVEVSDTTLPVDLGSKQRIYAAAGVPEYWVADVNGRVIHRMWSPSGEIYQRHDKTIFGQSISAATLDDIIIDTDVL